MTTLTRSGCSTIPYDAMSWMLAPRAVFDRGAAIETCLDRDACLRSALIHGLCKAMMPRMADLDMSNQTLKSVSGHSNDAEAAHYTRSADQMHMADNAIAKLSTWEKSNPI